MKKSYRRAARRRHVVVHLPIEAVRLLNAAHAEKYFWHGENCRFVPNRRALDQAVKEHLAHSLAVWLSAFIADYGENIDPRYPDWDVNRLLTWLSASSGWDQGDAIKWLSIHTDLANCGFVKDDEGVWTPE